MLRISTNRPEPGRVVVKLEGDLRSGWVDELRSAVERARKSGERIAIDLAGVRFVDRRGIALIRDLETNSGVGLENGTPFVMELLKGVER